MGRSNKWEDDGIFGAACGSAVDSYELRMLGRLESSLGHMASIVEANDDDAARPLDG